MHNEIVKRVKNFGLEWLGLMLYFHCEWLLSNERDENLLLQNVISAPIVVDVNMKLISL